MLRDPKPRVHFASALVLRNYADERLSQRLAINLGLAFNKSILAALRMNLLALRGMTQRHVGVVHFENVVGRKRKAAGSNL